MSRTLAQLQTTTRRLIGNPTTGQVSDALLTELLNDGVEMLSVKYAFRDTQATATFVAVVSTTSYSAAADLLVMRKLWNDTQKYPLTGPYSDRMLAETPTRSNGRPLRFSFYGQAIVLDPPPSATDTFKYSYTRHPTAMSASGDYPELPSSWHYGLCLFTRWLYYSELQDYPKAQNALNLFNLFVRDTPTPLESEAEFADVPTALDELGSFVAPTVTPWDNQE